MHFKDITYLKKGTLRQQQAFKVLTTYAVMDILQPYSPILTGTIPLAIDISGSDLDIICCWENQDHFKNILQKNFFGYRHFRLTEKYIRNQLTVLANFWLDDFEVEIFGQNQPTVEQFAYRHLLAEHRLLKVKGNLFQNAVRDLKLRGIKTEPAFAQVLGLSGDPYLELLQYYLPDGATSDNADVIKNQV